MVFWPLFVPFQDCLVFEHQQDREEQFNTNPQSRHSKLVRGSGVTPGRCRNHRRVEHKPQQPMLSEAILPSQPI
jgi:hypothetical protein